MIRPSTLLRVAEDALISATSNVARRTKSFVHSTKIEYRARMLANAQAAVEQAAAAVEAMDEESINQLLLDQRAVEARCAELMTRRK